MTPRVLLLAGLMLLWTGCSAPANPSPSPPADSFQLRVQNAQESAFAYLLSRQDADGAWRSKRYATYQDGVSLSPLVIKALVYGPSGPTGQEAARRGIEFLVPKLPPAPNKLTFPNYCLAISALALAREPAHQATREALVDFLRRQQLVESLGWKPDDLDYGGWGEARTPYHRPASGKVDPSRAANLSVTMFVLGALRVSGVPADDPAVRKAQVFVFRCQNFEPGDGGFYFSPGNLHQNKAGGKTSYGSMTADGLRALLRTGLGNDHPRVAAARQWILSHFDPAHNSGDFPPGQEKMRDALYYYYCWSTAHALVESGAGNTWARPMLEQLLARQKPDGSWVNSNDRMTEDEPLVATTMALAALTLADSVLGTQQEPSGLESEPSGHVRATPSQ